MVYIMNRCLKCNVEIGDDTGICPLCRCVLLRDKDLKTQIKYPAVGQKKERMKYAVRVYVFAAILGFVVLCIINYMSGAAVRWDLLTGGVLVYGYLTLQLSFLNQNGYRFTMFWQTLGAMALVIFIDGILGFQGWSLNYVLPAGLVLLDIAVGVLMAVNSRNWQSYIPVEIVMIVLSLIPLFLHHIHVTDQWYPAIGCFGISIFLFLGTVILGGKRAVTELKRRFHV